ncbi:MAG: enoyl-CoA hydratase/isomerase family protein, partial [Rubrobacter sp.]|nr:enoyl-CoA hydratase/isomerase family protein [Rubrobacter sp.]
MAVSYGREGGVGYITLDRPPANSYDYGFMRELGEAVREAEEDTGAGAIILRSANERFFSAGADVKAFAASTTEENMRMIREAHQNLARIAAVPKVFIAQISGT